MGRNANLEVTQSIIVTRPIAEVFAYRSALQNTSEWEPSVLASELAAPGMTGVGARSTERRRGPNKSVELWDLEITEYERDSVVGIVAQCGSIRVVERHIFNIIAENTRYTLSVQVIGSSLTEGVVRKNTVDSLVHFRRQLEAIPDRLLPPRTRPSAGADHGHAAYVESNRSE